MSQRIAIKMKHFKTGGALGLFFLAFLLLPAPICSGDGVQFTASLQPVLGLTIELHKNSSTGAIVDSIDFGTLQVFTNPANGKKTLRSSTAGSTGSGSIVAMLYPAPTGAPYNISVSATTPLTNTNGITIPAGACVVVPVYSPLDNNFGAGPQPLVGTLGTRGSWVTASPGRRIYTSNSAGAYRAIQAHFAITDDPAAGASSGVPVDQIVGSYTSTVTFTITE